MSTPHKVVALILLTIFSFCLAPYTAQAATFSATYTITGPGSCNANSFSVPGTFAFNFPTAPGGTGQFVDFLNGAQIFQLGPYPILLGNVPTTPTTFGPASPLATQTSNYVFTRRIGFAFNGTTFSSWLLTVNCNLGTGVATGSWANLNSTGGVTFFNPGDDRVDPRPGDRIAVWCNPPDTIVVYGVKETDSGGFWLVSFSNKALLKAGKNVGIYKPVPNNGQVSVSTDGQGNYWVAWNGGEHKADGQPGRGFAKGFQCTFPK